MPWATEFSALSWNLLVLLVLDSSEFRELWVPSPTNSDNFPLDWRAPLAYATFDPNDPANADLIGDIELLPDTPENQAQIQQLRAQIKPICSLITPSHCDKVREFFSYTAVAPPDDAVEAEPAMRHWLWETGAQYAVSESQGSLARTQTVHAAGPRLPETPATSIVSPSITRAWPVMSAQASGGRNNSARAKEIRR